MIEQELSREAGAANKACKAGCGRRCEQGMQSGLRLPVCCPYGISRRSGRGEHLRCSVGWLHTDILLYTFIHLIYIYSTTYRALQTSQQETPKNATNYKEQNS